MDDGSCLKTLIYHNCRKNTVKLTSDNNKIISGYTNGTIKIWDLETGYCLNTLEGHKDWITSIELTSDNSKIIQVVVIIQ